jgi:SAM-dependent methyltransferase
VERRRSEHIYDDRYSRVYDEIYLSSKYHHDVERLGDVLARVDPKERVLDVGCGTGTLCGLLGATHPRVEGLDLSDHMLAEARRKCPALQFRHGNLLDHHLYDAGTFGLILSQWDVLNYLESTKEYAMAFANFRRWLRPGGWLCIELLVDQQVAGDGPHALASTMVDSNALRVDGAWDLRDSAHLIFRESIVGAESSWQTTHDLFLLPLDTVVALLTAAGLVVRDNVGDDVNPFLCCQPRRRWRWFGPRR